MATVEVKNMSCFGSSSERVMRESRVPVYDLASDEPCVVGQKEIYLERGDSKLGDGCLRGFGCLSELGCDFWE